MNYSSLERGFIDAEKLKEEIGQGAVFSLVFGEIPVIGKKYRSPFRTDNNPSCYFEIDYNNNLRFVDFANSDIINGIKMTNISCFDAVRVYYRISNFYLTLRYIKTLYLSNKLKANHINYSNQVISKEKTIITTTKRPFNQTDKEYWGDLYDIPFLELEKDDTTPVSSFSIHKGDWSKEIPCEDISYDIGGIKGKKVYRPLVEDKKEKFRTTCTQDDIGGLKHLKESKSVTITKSYKDHVVLRMMGINNVWIPAETSNPSVDAMSIFKDYPAVFILFDIDEPGKKASVNFKTYSNTLGLNPKIVNLSDYFYQSYGAKDSSDVVRYMSKEVLQNYFKQEYGEIFS